MTGREILLFVCDSLMSGEPDHALVDQAVARGVARTESGHHLVDLGATGALLEGGLHHVAGELYALTPQQLAVIDVRRGHPLVHQRRPVKLEDGAEAEAYFISEDQARGLRRVRNADWRARYGASRTVEPGALVKWAKRRFSG